MDVKKLSKLSREFRINSSRLLSTKYGSEQQDLSRFLLFIENTPLIKDFIYGCIKESIDFKDIISKKGWNSKLKLPLSSTEEVSYIYQLLKYIESHNAYSHVSMGYGNGNKYQDHIDAFNQEVTVHLINHVREHLEDIIIGMEPISLEVVEEVSSKIFISYCWNDNEFADLIDKDLQNMGYTLTRDIRDIGFKDSIKKFMESIGNHDFVISIISDNYLKSVNCMYEISEVMRSREYKDKMLLLILKDSDTEFLSSLPKKSTMIAANVYTLEQRIEYIVYWEEKEKEYSERISKITQETSKIQPLQELKKIQNITSNISEFLSEISDWNNTNLSELKESNYASFIKEIKQVVN